MNTERLIELINAGIDGELDEARQSELQQALDQSAEARNLQAELLAITATFSALPEREPPDDLHKNILNNVNLPSAGNRGFRHFKLSHYTGYGLALAAGFIMIVGIYQYGPRDPTAEDVSRMTGTIAQQSPAGQPGERDSLSIDLDAVNGVVTLAGSGDEFVLEFNLDTTAATSLVVEFDNEGLQFDGFIQSGNELEGARVSEGTIRISTSGKQQFALNLSRIQGAPGNAAVHVTTSMYTGGGRVHQGELTVQ